jgi:hypothetical protein
MRGSRIFHHTEKVGGRRKERTVWDRVCRSPKGALGEESIQYLYNSEPLFRTVGNDSTFYRLETANQLRHYLN